MFWERVIWYMKQLLPLRYETIYGGTGGKRYLSIWRMWFGRCFNVRTWELAPNSRERSS